jgi:acyl-CoA synthetase (AMP-forming)/AMP-acid ligase II
MRDTTPALVREAAARFGARPAIVDGAVTLSFAQLASAVEACARAFVGRGIARGDRVAIWAPNSWRWQVAALGAHAAGAVLVPLNTRFKGRETAFILQKSGARALVVDNQFLGVDRLAQLREAGATVEHIIPLDDAGWAAFLDGGGSVRDAAARAAAVREDDDSDLIFTSGTTGAPKGVCATHGQTIRVFRTWCEVVGLDADDRYLIVNPYFHTFGYKAGWLACLLTGACALPQPVFDVAAVLARVEHERVTVLPGPPTLYHAILEHPSCTHHDLRSLRLAVTGAATIPVELIRRMRAELTFKTVLTAYGLTEATGVVSMCRRDDDLETIARTSGRAIPGVEVRVVGGDGGERPRGEPGEVWVRGYNVMRGYWNDPEATAAAVDREGWLHTGDVGVMDARGNLRITDRLKDLFIVGGFNAYPAEIENLLLSHPKIAQAAVVGVPDARLGEVGFAFIVLRASMVATVEEIVEWARGEMANYKVPRYLEIVSELPLNAAGKVQRVELRTRARATVRS